MHLVTPPPHPPAKNNHCFQYLLDIKVVPREIEDNGYLFIYAHFFRSFFGGGGGGDKLHHGLRENGDLEYRHVDDGKNFSDTIACGSGATFLF